MVGKNLLLERSLVLLAFGSILEVSFNSFVGLCQLVLHLFNFLFGVVLLGFGWLWGLGRFWGLGRLLGGNWWWNSGLSSWSRRRALIRSHKSICDDREVPIRFVFLLSWLWLFFLGFNGLWGLSWLLFSLWWLGLLWGFKLGCLDREVSLVGSLLLQCLLSLVDLLVRILHQFFDVDLWRIRFLCHLSLLSLDLLGYGVSLRLELLEISLLGLHLFLEIGSLYIDCGLFLFLGLLLYF